MLLCWPDSEQVGFPQPVGWMIVKKNTKKKPPIFCGGTELCHSESQGVWLGSQLVVGLLLLRWIGIALLGRHVE